MNASRRFAFALALALVVAGCSRPATEQAATPAADSTTTAASVTALELQDPWVRPTPAGATAGAAYVTLVSPEADRLVGASVPAAVAGSTELHAVVSDSTGGMTMKHVDAIDLPAQTPVKLEPGSFHVMLFDLVKPLAPGDSVAVTLHFEKAGERTLIAPVREP